MVQTVYSNGSNSIWEHSILDPASGLSGKRKTNLQDKLQYVAVKLLFCFHIILCFVFLFVLVELFFPLIFECQKPKQNGIHKSQISNAGICAPDALSGG